MSESRPGFASFDGTESPEEIERMMAEAFSPVQAIRGLLADDQCRNCWHVHPSIPCTDISVDPGPDGPVKSVCGCSEYVDLEAQSRIVVRTGRVVEMEDGELSVLSRVGPEEEAIADPERATWTCTVTGPLGDLPPGADRPMREAIREAYFRVTGDWPTDIWSGWNGRARKP